MYSIGKIPINILDKLKLLNAYLIPKTLLEFLKLSINKY